MGNRPGIYRIQFSAWWTVLGIVLLFSTAILVTLLAPSHVDPTWTQPTSPYQVQMYEVEDPHLYISSSHAGGKALQYVNHLKQDFSLLAFVESETVRIIAPPELRPFVTERGDAILKLTSHLLLLRPIDEAEERGEYRPRRMAEEIRQEGEGFRLAPSIYELYDPQKSEAFALSYHDGIFGQWIDSDFRILDGEEKIPYQTKLGVIFTKNPSEFRVMAYRFGEEIGWRYHPNGKPVADLEQLRSPSLGFRSRKELIEYGEHIYAIEGCWYCHTDQTRTLVQDLVLNGSAEFPSPPSSPNEFIFQKITFPGTRRIGPDLSREGVKRPHRDWHISHFWAPRTESPGSIMPSFRHFFDYDPRGSMTPEGIGIPNYRFESIYQYLMTRGTRITPPNQAWWEGRDPVQTLAIIEGKKSFRKKEEEKSDG